MEDTFASVPQELEETPTAIVAPLTSVLTIHVVSMPSVSTKEDHTDVNVLKDSKETQLNNA